MRDLDAILPEYKRVTQAPKFADLERYAEENDLEIDHVMEGEARNRYKACDARGNVWLIQNPALLTFRSLRRDSGLLNLIREPVRGLDSNPAKISANSGVFSI